MNKTPSVSIIITTFNEQRHIRNILSSIADQTYKHVETIVVDDGSTDGTPDVAATYKGVKVYPQQHRERSVQRNFGARKSKGEYLLFLDCDMILTPGVIEDCVKTVKKYKYSALIIPEKSIGEGFWSRVKSLERSWYLGDDDIEAERFYKKTIFIKAGGFNEQITGPEDWDLPRRTRKLGSHGRVSSLILHNEGKQTFWRMVKKKYYYSLNLSKYLQVNKLSTLSTQQVYFFRPSIYKNIFHIWRDPKTYLGVWILLLSQTISGGLGYIIGKWQTKV